MLKTFILSMVLIAIIGCEKVERIDLTGLPNASYSDMTQVYAIDDSTYRDSRLNTVKELGFFKYNPDPAKIEKAPSIKLNKFQTLQSWEERKSNLKDHIRVSTGLWPMPDKLPLKAKIFDQVNRPGYSVEKVYFESYPGFFVTGSLYRPLGKEGPFPAILTPHGHWSNGRLEESDRNSLAARCINFAKQGYVVFSWDMVGYNDSGKQVGHRFTDSRKHELWSISIMGLQLWNSIRSVDFLVSLPDVDSTKIGCTGESGGGTQTFMLTAVDARIKVSSPVNMISALFQGGCICENAPGLRLETFNVEIGAMMAPRPMKLIATLQDWTHDTPQMEYPMIRSIYELYNAGEKIEYAQFDYPHNYNKTSREAVYPFFAKWLKEDPEFSRYTEKEYQPEPKKNLLSFLGDRQPPSDLNEEKLTNYLISEAKKTFEQTIPIETEGKINFEETYGRALKNILATSVPDEISIKIYHEAAAARYKVSGLLFSEKGKNNWIPAIFFQPEKSKNEAVLIIHPDGKKALINNDTKLPAQLVSGMLEDGKSVLLMDVYNTGEHVLLTDMRKQKENVRHFTTYNRTETQQRIQDIVTASCFLRDFKKISIIGLKEAGSWVLLASSLTKNLQNCVVDMNNKSVSNEEYLIENCFIPGLLKYDGLTTAILLNTTKNMVIFNLPSRPIPDEALTLLNKSSRQTYLDQNLSETELLRFVL